MNTVLHDSYVFAGKIINYCYLVFWRLRDKISPPNTDAVLFVAHPDDDTLFFHTFIKQNHPYVCLMTTGWSLRRVPCFFKCMRRYGVRFRVYPLGAKDDRMHLLIKQVREVLSVKNFSVIATHNAEGEYGHEEHQRVHHAVVSACYSSRKTLLCPVTKDKIQDYPLSQRNIDEKKDIFTNIYTTETWVLSEEAAGTPVWVTHEHLTINTTLAATTLN